MNLRRCLPCALLALGAVLPLTAHAATVTYSSTFANDASILSINLTPTTPQTYTFTTNSYAVNGIVPDLTLFNSTTGNVVGTSPAATTGFGDVSFTQTLAAGSYVLDLSVYPNEAIGTLAQGFLFTTPGFSAGNCSATGAFYNDYTCTPTSGFYSLTVTNSAQAVTPEPSTLLLVLPSTALFAFARRRFSK